MVHRELTGIAISHGPAPVAGMVGHFGSSITPSRPITAAIPVGLVRRFDAKGTAEQR